MLACPPDLNRPVILIVFRWWPFARRQMHPSRQSSWQAKSCGRPWWWMGALGGRCQLGRRRVVPWWGPGSLDWPCRCGAVWGLARLPATRGMGPVSGSVPSCPVGGMLDSRPIRASGGPVPVSSRSSFPCRGRLRGMVFSGLWVHPLLEVGDIKRRQVVLDEVLYIPPLDPSLLEKVP